MNRKTTTHHHTHHRQTTVIIIQFIVGRQNTILYILTEEINRHHWMNILNQDIAVMDSEVVPAVVTTMANGITPRVQSEQEEEETSYTHKFISLDDFVRRYSLYPGGTMNLYNVSIAWCINPSWLDGH